MHDNNNVKGNIALWFHYSVTDDLWWFDLAIFFFQLYCDGKSVFISQKWYFDFWSFADLALCLCLPLRPRPPHAYQLGAGSRHQLQLPVCCGIMRGSKRHPTSYCVVSIWGCYVFSCHRVYETPVSISWACAAILFSLWIQSLINYMVSLVLYCKMSLVFDNFVEQ